VQGITGTQGETGVQGITGTQGETGVQGITGERGEGSQGPQGEPGEPGGPGEPGEPGEPGDPGEDGVGSQGPTGAQGTRGTTGTGIQGIQGITGGGGLPDYLHRRKQSETVPGVMQAKYWVETSIAGDDRTTTGTIGQGDVDNWMDVGEGKVPEQSEAQHFKRTALQYVYYNPKESKLVRSNRLHPTYDTGWVDIASPGLTNNNTSGSWTNVTQNGVMIPVPFTERIYTTLVYFRDTASDKIINLSASATLGSDAGAGIGLNIFHFPRFLYLSLGNYGFFLTDNVIFPMHDYRGTVSNTYMRRVTHGQVRLICTMITTNDGFTYNQDSKAQVESGYRASSNDDDYSFDGLAGGVARDQFQETWWGYNYGGVNGDAAFAQTGGAEGEKSRYFGTYNPGSGNSNLQAAQWASSINGSLLQLSAGGRTQVNSAEAIDDGANDGFISAPFANATQLSTWSGPTQGRGHVWRPTLASVAEPDGGGEGMEGMEGMK